MKIPKLKVTDWDSFVDFSSRLSVRTMTDNELSWWIAGLCPGCGCTEFKFSSEVDAEHECRGCGMEFHVPSMVNDGSRVFGFVISEPPGYREPAKYKRSRLSLLFHSCPPLTLGLLLADSGFILLLATPISVEFASLMFLCYLLVIGVMIYALRGIRRHLA